MKLYASERPLPLIHRSGTGSKDLPAARQTADSPAFESLFEQYWARIYRLLVRMLGDPAEAEDVALEAFLRLHNSGPRPDDHANVGGWLYRVATNLGLHSIRAVRRRDFYEQSAGRIVLGAPSDASPLEIASERESQQLARLALAQMKPERAQLLILRYSGVSYKDIASALHLSPTSVGPLLLRAEREFEKRYRALAQEDL